MMPAEEPEHGNYKIVFEVDYSHFVTFHGWLFLVQLAFGIIAMACCAPAPFSTQIYFMIVICFGFIGTILLCLAHLRFPTFNKLGKQGEFVYTAAMTFFYFTAFTAQFADLGGFTTEEYAHRYAAQIVAGVFACLIEITYIIIIYTMVPDALAWYEEYKGETKPPAQQTTE